MERMIDVMLKCARMLDIKEIYDDPLVYNIGVLVDGVVNGDAPALQSNKKYAKMWGVVNLVLEEIGEHVKPIGEKTLNSSSKHITLEFSSMIKITKILSVHCKHGKQNFKFENDMIKLDHDDNFTIKYRYVPCYTNSNLHLEDSIRIKAIQSLTFGICAYYCLSAGLFDEYQLYYEQYKDSLKNIVRPKTLAMPQRKWQ